MRWEHELTYLMRSLAGKDLGSLCYVCDWTRPGVRRIIGVPPHDEHACTSPRLGELLESYLRQDGFWHGPGFCTVIDPTGLSKEQRTAVALHECGHWFCFHHRISEQHGENWKRYVRQLQRRCPVRVTLESIGDVLAPA